MKTFEQFINESIDNIDNIDDSILNILHINELNIKFNFFEQVYSETHELYFCFVDDIFFIYEKRHELIWISYHKDNEIIKFYESITTGGLTDDFDYTDLNNRLIKFFSKYFDKVTEIRDYQSAHRNGLKKLFKK